MYFHISSGSVHLVDPQDVTSFRAVRAADLGAEELAVIVQREGLGEMLPSGDHLMVALDAVRRMAAGRVGPGWERDLDAMVAYAAGKGWLSADGTRVRAHVETDGA